MRPQLEDFTVLPGEEVVEVQQAWNPLQEQCELLFDLFGFVGDLPVGPAKNPPSLVDEAILLEKIILVLGDLLGQRERARSDRRFQKRPTRQRSAMQSQ